MRRKLFIIFNLLLAIIALCPGFALAADSSNTEAQNILGTLILAIMLPVAAIIGKLMAALIKRSISKIDNTIAQQLSWQAVVWAENTLKQSSGKEKFQKAYEWLAKKLPGMKKEDIEKFIETALAEMDKNLT